ncbi:DUF4309 domain-containing protein [Shimazuella kribbensis]|uniref:DUF4309 domain-containing protein n=1 Tax=Shimazuella kribbensis TaxID=139808 RepID=UPI000401FAB5|nr:DUF4309 domain-containing protein [Shimazuella kribbensis]
MKIKKEIRVFFAFLFAAGLLFSVIHVNIASAAQSSNRSKSNEQLLEETKQDASEGKVINSRFGIGSEKDAITNEYGKPGPKSTSDFLDYPKRHVSFELENKRVVWIITKDPNLLKVKQSEVEKVFGEPDHVGIAAGHVYWNYKIGNYEVIFNWQNVDPDVGKLLDVTVR